jgi:hypothetical protein
MRCCCNSGAAFTVVGWASAVRSTRIVPGPDKIGVHPCLKTVEQGFNGVAETSCSHRQGAGSLTQLKSIGKAARPKEVKYGKQ